MGDYFDYYYFKSKKILKIYDFFMYLLGIAIIVVAVVQTVNGIYEIEDTLKIIAVGIGLTAFTVLQAKFFLWLCTKGYVWCIIALALTIPMGLALYFPMLQYYRGDIPETRQEKILRKEDERCFKATVRAYQKAWYRQQFFQRVVVPLLYVGLFIGAIKGMEYLSNTNTTAFGWVMAFICLFAFFLVYALLGGLRTVNVRYDHYNVSVGQTIFDYGELNYNYSHSEYKEEMPGSTIGMILAFLAIPFVVVAAAVVICLFICLQILKLIFPAVGKRTIYLHKRKIGVGIDYVPFANTTFISGIMMVINRIMGAVFRVNFVNDDFWISGSGPDYIRQNLSYKNLNYLEKLLDKVERKFGYVYEF